VSLGGRLRAMFRGVVVVWAATASARADDVHWAFQPVREPAPPGVRDAAWPTSPIDHFILAELEAHRLRPAPSTDRRTLLRRVTFDLTGLPPRPAEIDAFLADDSPNAFATVVDRLLTSPRYGERWGRHWLDIVRFAETAAHDGNNAYLHAWRYRDYVIDAFNADKPYDAFIIEQLAGDLLPQTDNPASDYNRIVATGFLQVGTKPVVMRDKRQMLLDIADEQLSTTGIAFMGLTLGCARCHDHKFDPIPTADYYAMAGIFTSTHVMADNNPDSMWLEYKVPDADGEPVKVMAVRDLATPANLQVHERGNYRTLGVEAPRRFLSVIAGENHTPIDTAGSGRFELARWIARGDHPLTARVMVNRIWQHHFGAGLVRSSDNFGTLGEPPSHPALLDWLATRFVKSGWSIKTMHRLMLNSSIYRQSGHADAEADPDNRLLSRMVRRRLSAEEVRDTLLAVTGGLDLSMGGTLFTQGYTPVDAQRELFTVDISGKGDYAPFQQPRRSIYLPMIRNSLPPVLTLFDAANAHEPTTRRSETTVAPQSLYMMNSPHVRKLTLHLARDLLADAEFDDDTRLRIIHERLYGRPPSTEELEAGRAFLAGYVRTLDPDGRLARAARARAAEAEARRYAEAPEPTRRYDEVIREARGLIAYYRFDEMSKAINSAAPDRASGTHVGEVGQHRPGVDRTTAVKLNGRDARVQIDDAEFFNASSKQLTVEYWINPADVRTATVIGRDDLGAGARYWKSGIMDKTVDGEQKNVVFHEFFDNNGGFRTSAETAYVAEVGQWTHVAFTHGDGKRRLYINGRPVDELSTAGAIPTGPVAVTIGSRFDNLEWFNGGVDEVAVYDIVLDEAVIGEHYQAGGGKLTPTRPPLPPSPRELAWRSYGQALLCTNEFIFVD